MEESEESRTSLLSYNSSCDSVIDPEVMQATLKELEETKNYRGTIFAGDDAVRRRRRKAYCIFEDVLAKSDTTASDEFLQAHVPKLLENFLVDIKRSVVQHPFDDVDHDLKEYALRCANFFVSKEETLRFFTLAVTRQMMEAAMSIMSDAFQSAPVPVAYSCALVAAMHYNLPQAYTSIFANRLCETLVCVMVEAFDEGEIDDLAPAGDDLGGGGFRRATKKKVRGRGLGAGIGALEALGSLLEVHGKDVRPIGGTWATAVCPHLLHSDRNVRRYARQVMEKTVNLLWPLVPPGVAQTTYLALKGPPAGTEEGATNADSGMPNGSLITQMTKMLPEAPEDVVSTWRFVVHLSAARIVSSRSIVNGLCKVARSAFASKSLKVKVAMFKSWRVLIDVFAHQKCFDKEKSKSSIKPQKLVALLSQPMLRAGGGTSCNREPSVVVRQAVLDTWAHFLDRMDRIDEGMCKDLLCPLLVQATKDSDPLTRLKAARICADTIHDVGAARNAPGQEPPPAALSPGKPPDATSPPTTASLSRKRKRGAVSSRLTETQYCQMLNEFIQAVGASPGSFQAGSPRRDQWLALWQRFLDGLKLRSDGQDRSFWGQKYLATILHSITRLQDARLAMVLMRATVYDSDIKEKLVDSTVFKIGTSRGIVEKWLDTHKGLREDWHDTFVRLRDLLSMHPVGGEVVESRAQAGAPESDSSPDPAIAAGPAEPTLEGRLEAMRRELDEQKERSLRMEEHWKQLLTERVNDVREEYEAKLQGCHSAVAALREEIGGLKRQFQ
jgi:hypothetical protein